jgi:hypothetical protein
MTTTSAAAAALAASCTAAPDAPPRATALIHAARLLLPALERGQPIDAAVLRAAMEHAVGASDSEGGWDWKSAYDACEAAAVLFLRKFGGAMAVRAGSAAALLPMLAGMARLLPSGTRRSVEGEHCVEAEDVGSDRCARRRGACEAHGALPPPARRRSRGCVA